MLELSHFKKGLLMLWGFTITAFIVYILYQTSLAIEQRPEMGALEALRVVLESYVLRVQDFLKSKAVLGPLIILVIYVLRPFVFLPASILTIITGAVFGPFYGMLITIFGENMAANSSFLVARYFAGDSDPLSKIPLLKQTSKKLGKASFFYVFISRLLWVPFDLVSYGFGLTKIPWRAYFWGTFWGTFPGMITVVLLGSSVILGKSVFVIAFILFVATLLGSYVCKKCMQQSYE